MITMDPLPQGIRTLTAVESARLRADDHTLPPTPKQCITCKGDGWFMWRGPDGQPTKWDCNCTDQWKMHRYFIHSGLGLQYQRLGWTDIDTTDGNEANEYAHTWLESPVHSVVLTGQRGTGKTLVASLMLRARLAAGQEGYMTTYERLVSDKVSTWRDDEQKQIFERTVHNIPVLVIDDPGRESSTSPTAMRTIESVIRHRTAAATPTIITTNMNHKAMTEHYGPHATDLLMECAVIVTVSGSNWRTGTADNRVGAEVKAGLRRPIVIG